VSAKDRGVTPTGTSLGSYISHRAVVAPRNTKANISWNLGGYRLKISILLMVLLRVGSKCAVCGFVQLSSQRKAVQFLVAGAALSRVHATFRSADCRITLLLLMTCMAVVLNVFSKMHQLFALGACKTSEPERRGLRETSQRQPQSEMDLRKSANTQLPSHDNAQQKRCIDFPADVEQSQISISHLNTTKA
jgi:hypothetical protein